MFSRNPIGNDRSDSRAREPIATVYVTSKGIMVEWLSSNRIKRRVAIGSNFATDSRPRDSRGELGQKFTARYLSSSPIAKLTGISCRQRSTLTLHKHNFHRYHQCDRRHDSVNVMNATRIAGYCTTLMECSDNMRGEIIVYLRTL